MLNRANLFASIAEPTVHSLLLPIVHKEEGTVINKKELKLTKPETDFAYLFAVHLNVGDIVLEDSGHVHLGELILAEHDEQAGLPAGAVTHYHQLLTYGSHCV